MTKVLLINGLHTVVPKSFIHSFIHLLLAAHVSLIHRCIIKCLYTNTSSIIQTWFI